MLALRISQKQAVVTLLSRRDLLASPFSFWFECDHCVAAEKLFARSVVRSFSDLTMIATDEERFSLHTGGQNGRIRSL